MAHHPTVPTLVQALAVVCVTLLVGCDEETATDGTTGGEVEGIPTEGAALRGWLEVGGYTDWPAESAPHASTGPHFGRVRTWVNPELEASLAAGEPEHPRGATAVKELYGDSGSQPLGWAVMVKLHEPEAGSGGDGWYWYEIYEGTTYADGSGVSLCTGCHSSGADFVLTPYPLQ